MIKNSQETDQTPLSTTHAKVKTNKRKRQKKKNK